MSKGVIARFYDYYRKEGIAVALKAAKKYAGTVFKLRYWRRHPIYLLCVKLYCIISRKLDSNRVTDADPFKLIWVDPETIQEMTITSHKHDWGIVTADNWQTQPIDELHLYQAAKKHFIEGKNHSRISQKTEELYQNMENEGYIPQRQIRPLAQMLPFHYRDFEIGVDIDADGELYWTGWGQHRISIAKVSEVDKIAVQVHRRHPKWQEIRDEIQNAESTDELSERARNQLGHPDLCDLI